MTDFRHRITIGTYSGGTVRDSHPVILFSKGLQTKPLPRSSFFSCHINHSTLFSGCQLKISTNVSIALKDFLCYNKEKAGKEVLYGSFH